MTVPSRFRLCCIFSAALLLAAAVGLALPTAALCAYPIATFMVPVNDIPEGLHAGDCNGDGVPDIIVADQGSQDLTILRNAGQARFAFFASIPAAGRPIAAVCADLDGDGSPDVASIDLIAGTLTIYMHGATGFQKTVTYPVGKLPTSVQVADLDHDGHPDIVVISESSRIMTIRFGDGTGAFPSSTTTTLSLRHPHSAVIADFDLDGNLDIGVIGRGTSGLRGMTLFHGDGHGIFTPSDVDLPALPAPQTAEAADLDGDGIPDVAVLSRDGTLSIYLGTPSGQFLLGGSQLLPNVAQSMDLADFDGDGVLDLALGLANFNSVALLKGLGNLQFAPFTVFSDLVPDTTVVEPAGSGAPRAGTFDDVIPSTDVIRVNPTTHALEMVDMGDGGTLQTSQLLLLPNSPTAVLLADMNNDGIADAVVATHGHGGTGLQVYFGNASGGYDPPPAATGTCGNGILEPGEVCDSAAPGCKACVPQIGSGIVSIVAADVNGDGNQDLVVVGAPGRLFLLLGNGHGQFTDVRLLAKTGAKLPAVVQDFDGDGFPDIVAVLHQTGARGLTLLQNDGTGTFTPIAIPFDGTVKGGLIAADFDRNGAPDLALGASGHGGSRIAVLFNDNTGAFPTVTSLHAPGTLQTLSAADFNEDGRLDLLGVFGSASRGTLMFFAGQPGGAFAEAAPAVDGGTARGTKVSGATIVDVNDDRHQDVVLCQSGTTTSCTPYFGTGAGSFTSTVPPTNPNYIGRQLKNVAVADIDGDGVLDFVGVSRRDARAVVLFRDAAGAIVAQTVLPTGGMKPQSLAIGDLNGDSLPDLVVANQGTNTVTVFLNQGNRQFQTLGPATLVPVGRAPSGVGLVDLDGDGKLDLVVSFQGTSNIGLFLIKDLQHLTEGGLVNIGSLKTGGAPVNMVVADLNADGIPDIVTVNNSGVPPPDVDPTPPDGGETVSAAQIVGAAESSGPLGTLTIYLSSAVGAYDRTDIASGGSNPWAVAVADVNKDNAPDLLVINSDDLPAAGNLVTFANDGHGVFTKLTTHQRGRKGLRDLCTGDIDGDGNVDVAIASTRTADVLILFGNADGTWRRGERVYSVGKFPRALACADVDGDGKSDVVFGRLNRGDIDTIQTKP